MEGEEAGWGRGRLGAAGWVRKPLGCAVWRMPQEGATCAEGIAGADPKHERQISGEGGARGRKGNPYFLVK